jgi:3-isopropylmalate/(R)-2-methylmalate dehydratase small subunit
MEKFIALDAIAACLPEANVNTDDILPSIWVLDPNTDLGEKLFANRRYDAYGAENPEFVLNRDPYRNAKILVSGANFGCGSSREAAVWALLRFGIRCVIAQSYGDIFYENCFQNGVLPIVLDAGQVTRLTDSLHADESKILHVDLREGSIRAPNGGAISFPIAEQRRDALLGGQDAMDQLLALRPTVDSFERSDVTERPWIYVRRGSDA